MGCFLKRRRLSREAFDVATKLLPHLKSSPYSYWSPANVGLWALQGDRAALGANDTAQGRAHLPCPPAPVTLSPCRSTEPSPGSRAHPWHRAPAPTQTARRSWETDRWTAGRARQPSASLHTSGSQRPPALRGLHCFPPARVSDWPSKAFWILSRAPVRGTGHWAPAFPPEKTRRSLRDGPVPVRVTSTLAAPVPAEIPAPPLLTCPCLPSAPPDLPPAPRRGPQGRLPAHSRSAGRPASESAGPQLCPWVGWGWVRVYAVHSQGKGAASWGATPHRQPPFPVPRTPSRKCPPRPRSTQ